MSIPESFLGKVQLLIKSILLVVSIYGVFNEFRLLNSGIYVSSQIIDLKCFILPEKINPLCLPIVKFTTRDGQAVIYQFNLTQSLLLHEQRGQKMSLYYQDINPKNVVVNNFSDKYVSLFWDVVIGGLIFLRSPKKKDNYIKLDT